MILEKSVSPPDRSEQKHARTNKHAFNKAHNLLAETLGSLQRYYFIQKVEHKLQDFFFLWIIGLGDTFVAPKTL